MSLLLFSAALTVVLAVLAAIWTGLRPPVDEPAQGGRLHHTNTCTCPPEPEGAPA